MVATPKAKGVLFVFLVSAVVRILWVANAEVTPVSDFAGYDQMAVRILSEWAFGNPAWRAYRTPGYPGFLALVYAVFGHSWQAAGFVQAVLGGMTSAIVSFLAGRVGGVRTCVIAGLLHAFWPTAIAYVPVLASENLAVALLMLGILLFSLAEGRAGWRRHGAVAASGAVCGLLLLVRPAAVFFLPAWGLWAVYGVRYGTYKMRSAVLFVIVLGVALSPWLIRNYRHGLGPLTLSTVGSLNFYMGNNDLTRAGGFCGEVEREDFAAMGERQRAAAYTAETFKWLCSHPRHYFALCGVRLARHLGTTADTWAARYLRPTPDIDRALVASREHRSGRRNAPDRLLKKSRQVRGSNARFLEQWRLVVAPLMLVALALSMVHWRRFAIVLLPAGCYVLGLGLTFGAERFRQLSDPLLIVPLAALISDLIFKTSHLGTRPSRLVKAALVVASIIVSIAGQKTGVWDRFYILPEAPAPIPDVSNLALNPIRFTKSGQRYRSDRWTIGVRRSKVTLGGAALRCEVRGGENVGVSQYAGVKFHAPNPKALQLDLTWINPSGILAVFVDGYDSAGRRQPLWSWDFNEKTYPLRRREVYTLVPGRRSGYFRPREDADSVDVQDVHFFVMVKPATSTGFVLHNVRIASE